MVGRLISGILVFALIFSTTMANASSERAALGLSDPDQCIQQVAERLPHMFQGIVASACFRLFNAPVDRRRSQYECIVNYAREHRDTESLSAMLTVCPTPPAVSIPVQLYDGEISIIKPKASHR